MAFVTALADERPCQPRPAGDTEQRRAAVLE